MNLRPSNEDEIQNKTFLFFFQTTQFSRGTETWSNKNVLGREFAPTWQNRETSEIICVQLHYVG